jgi:hypothetical protein
VTTARRLTAEFAGIFAPVFAECGAIMVDAQTGALGHTSPHRSPAPP